MKIKQIVYDRRVNLGNYEHEHYSLTAEVEPGECPLEVLASLAETVVASRKLAISSREEVDDEIPFDL